MYHFHADDGRILTPPKELEPRLKGAFPAFSKLLGHIRFNYVADEIWDGKSSLVFKADGEQLAAVTLDDGAFHVRIAGEEFGIADEALLDTVFEALKKTASPAQRRPFEQRTINGCPCGRRCDLCLGSKEYSEDGSFSEGDNFGYMNWLCYHNCIDVKVNRFDGVFKCHGCEARRITKGVWDDWWDGCKYYNCLTEKGYANCVECGAYHSCDVFSDCLTPGQCNLGITAEEVTKLVIPYCMIERLDTAWRV